MALKDGDIITLDYEGRTDGVLFDTTLEKVAKKEAKKRPARRRVPVRWIRRSIRIRRQKRDAATKPDL